jgi:hypothetical protein
VAVNDPTHVTGLVRPQQVGRSHVGPGAQAIFDDLHGGDEAALVGAREPSEQGADVVPRPGVKYRKCLPPRSSKAQQALPAIGFRACPVDQAGVVEAAQDAAQVTAVEVQFLGESGCRGLSMACHLKENARLGKGERTADEAFLQHTDPPGVEAVESACRLDAPGKVAVGHGVGLQDPVLYLLKSTI